jgi:hypothetical protein
LVNVNVSIGIGIGIAIPSEDAYGHAPAINLGEEVSTPGVNAFESCVRWHDCLSLTRIHFVCWFGHGSLLTFSVTQFLIEPVERVCIRILNARADDRTSWSSADVRQSRRDRELTTFR